MKATTLAALDEARTRTRHVLAPYDDAALTRQHSPLMSPLVWDLAHIAHYEELWLLRELGRAGATDPRFDDMYDAFKHARAERPDLDLLDPAAARTFGDAVRARVIDTDRAGAPPADDRARALLADDFVGGLVVRHEHQHVETMLATIQLMAAGAPAAGADGPGRRCTAPGIVGQEVLVPGGPFVMGSDVDPWAYDNEQPAHVVDVPSFHIDATPVTNGSYAEFVAAGGYDDPQWWSPTGWQWRVEAGLVAPQFWTPTADGWQRRRFGRVEPVPTLEPVQHVCFHEADAYARWAGKRLPTEAEWEKAASWDPGDGQGTKQASAWEQPGARPEAVASVWSDDRRFGPDEVGAHPDGATRAGVHDMLGGVWEWTSSTFAGYPGFRAFPYPEYSEVFFGEEYVVLRGGSWATHPLALSTTFRNWDFPIRRQIFSGFRCARDA